MYSSKIQKTLKKKKIKTGQRVKISKGKKEYEGLLMPRPDAGDPDCLVLKLDNGYNLGIKWDKKTKIKKSRKKGKKETKEEEEFELGRIKKELMKLEFDEKKPDISLIATGGTVASRVDYRTGGVTGAMNPREFLHNVPELKEIVNLKKIDRLSTKMSEDFNYKDWQKMAKKIKKELNSGMEGIILTEGTDTMHYTSAALSFFLRNLNKPVVITGAQKSSDRGSSDAGMNLICSARVAVSDMAEVGICMHGTLNDDYCLFLRGTKVRKMNTIRRDAFRPINQKPIAKIWPDGKTEKMIQYNRRKKKGKVKTDLKFEPKVALLKTYPGSEPEVIDFLVDKGYKGFVLEGTGLGHVPTEARKNWIPKIEKHTKEGIPFVVTSQTIYGRVNTNVYSNLRTLFKEAGAISGEDMLSETAYIKLGWVLGHTKKLEEVRRKMAKNYTGEITERTLPDSYLY